MTAGVTAGERFRSWADIQANAARGAGGLAALGVGEDDSVALMLRNDFATFEVNMAAGQLGAYAVPINWHFTPEEAGYILGDCGAKVLVAHTDLLAQIASGVPAGVKVLAVPTPEEIAAAYNVPPEKRLAHPRIETWDAFVAQSAPNTQPPKAARGSMIYTSGTTGRPKGCVLSNFYYLNAGAWYRGLGGRLAIEPGRERFLNPLPLFHMNCQAVTATCAILTGNCLILPERFSPRRWWPDVVATRATIIHYLGVMPPLLLNQAPSPEETAHRVKAGLGAGVEPELHEAFERRFGFPLVEVWGMTETGRILSDCHEPRSIHTRAFGRPHGGLEARVVDDQGREVPRETEGELLVRWGGPEGPRHGFFSGYLGNDEATAEAWRGEWFHTGDVVRQAADGMLVFVDRKKNIIRRAGENIAAAEVEAVLQAHEAVAQVAVLAVPDEIREEEVMACVVPMPGVVPGRGLAERLADHCLERLAYFKAPGWVLFVERLPTTGTQKVQKAQIFPRGEDPRARAGALDLRGRKKRG
jgi:crotonobetaine/carnitine-CoA ligase